jgi:hypothetical protein
MITDADACALAFASARDDANANVFNPRHRQSWRPAGAVTAKENKKMSELENIDRQIAELRRKRGELLRVYNATYAWAVRELREKRGIDDTCTLEELWHAEDMEWLRQRQEAIARELKEGETTGS